MKGLLLFKEKVRAGSADFLLGADHHDNSKRMGDDSREKEGDNKVGVSK